MMQELQEQQNRKSTKNVKSKQSTDSASDSVIEEELQKAITENARLASLVSDKNSEIDCYVNRVTELVRPRILCVSIY